MRLDAISGRSASSGRSGGRGLAATTLAAGFALVAGCSGGGPGDSAADSAGSSKTGSAGARADWPAKRTPRNTPVLRAVVSDAKSPDVLVVDVLTGKTLKRFKLAGPARLVPVGDGMRVMAPQREAGITNVVDTGIRIARGHGDYLDEAYMTPYLTPGKLKAPEPSSVVPYGRHVTVFADGNGSAYILHPDDTGVAPERVVRTGRAHRGVAVDLDHDVLTSLPAPGGKATPPSSGVQVFDAEGKPKQRFRDCPELDGVYAASGTVAVFGCADGVLLLEKKNDRWTSRKLRNPAGTRADERANAFTGEGTTSVLGTFGTRAVLSLDLEKARTKRIALPGDLAAYAWDGEWHQTYVLTADGNLHVVDAAKGRLRYTTKVTEPFRVSGDDAALRPVIAPGRDAVYIADPHTRRLIEVGVSKKKGLEVARKLKLDITPSSLAVIGLPIDPVEHDDSHEQGPDDGHGHDHD